jgi:Protein of unknown function (DUF3667).
MEELGALIETGGVAAVELAASAIAQKGGTAPACPSCGKPMIGPFCAICGQPRNTHRRSLKLLVHDLVKDIASFDSRILRTSRALLFVPGELPNAFRDGRTQPYVPAVRLYLFVSLLFFLFLSVTGIGLLQINLTAQHYRLVHDAAGNVYKEHDGKRDLLEGFKSDAHGAVTVAGAVDASAGDAPLVADGRKQTDLTSSLSFFKPRHAAAQVSAADLDDALKDTKIEVNTNGKRQSGMEAAIRATMSKLRSDPGALNEPMSIWVPRVLFVLLPLFAVLLALFYRRQRKDFLFVDHLVFSLTMHTFAFVTLIGAAALAQVMSATWVLNALLLVVAVYFFLSLKRFYRQGWWKTSIKFASMSLVYFLFFLIPALVFVLVASVIWA